MNFSVEENLRRNLEIINSCEILTVIIMEFMFEHASLLGSSLCNLLGN